jgi:RNA polymerase sigma-70 factor (ECF subfamily)
MITAGSSPRVLAASFDEFFARELAGLEAIAFGLTGRRALAEELAQEAMLVVYRRWHHVAGYDDPAAFARRVVSNMSVSAYRRLLAEARAINRIRRRREQGFECLGERDSALWAAVRALPARQAQALALRYVADLDTAGIAATLGCSEGNARVVLHRARQTLASRLGPGARGGTR